MTGKRCPRPEKIRHESKSAAMQHAKALRRRGASVDLLPYRCSCGCWHVGHSAASLRKRIRSAFRARYL